MNKASWYIYILECRNSGLYTGITTDLKRRFKQHKRGKGGAYTRSFKAKKIRYTERLATRQDALKREAEIKKFNREEKLSLIRNHSYR